MRTTVTFSGRVADVPQLLRTHEGRPYVTCRVLVQRRLPGEEGEAMREEPTAYHVKIYGTAAHNVYETLDTGDPIIVHGIQATEAWLDRDSGETFSKSVVVVDDDFGEVGVSLT